MIRLDMVIVVQALQSNVADRKPFSIGEDRLRWLAQCQSLDARNHSIRHREPRPLSPHYNTPGVQSIKFMPTLHIATWSKCDGTPSPCQHTITWRTLLGYLTITAKRNRAVLVMHDLTGHDLLRAPTRNTSLHRE